MVMLSQTKVFKSIQKKLDQIGVDSSARLLVCVSGGLDSMVLISNLKEMNLPITAAHVNFQLRGQDSDCDAELVRDWCSDHDVSYMELVVDTKRYAEIHKLNIQSAAREIRYDWWQKLFENDDYKFVITAHHHDDSIETFFINILRGTGIKGLQGIPFNRDHFIRPMIDISRNEIEAFAKDFNIPFRTDMSNESDVYQRNRIRHHLIPLLREINPHLNAVMLQETKRIGIELAAWNTSYQNWQKNSVFTETDGIKIMDEPVAIAFLLRWLEENGFPWQLSYDFVNSTNQDGSKELMNDKSRLSKTSDGYFLSPITGQDTIEINSTGTYPIGIHELKVELISISNFVKSDDPFVEYADLENIKWPLQVTPIKPGDYFQPIGMDGKSKKIQDYMVDLKLEPHEKRTLRLLKSGDQTLWIMGRRLDERIRITENSKEIFKLSYMLISSKT
ncbi:MAG: tRNA lysidine(34) synthetase TilS [Saprospiraceae bacterium]